MLEWFQPTRVYIFGKHRHKIKSKFVHLNIQRMCMVLYSARKKIRNKQLVLLFPHFQDI